MKIKMFLYAIVIFASLTTQCLLSQAEPENCKPMPENHKSIIAQALEEAGFKDINLKNIVKMPKEKFLYDYGCVMHEEGELDGNKYSLWYKSSYLTSMPRLRLEGILEIEEHSIPFFISRVWPRKQTS